MAIKSNIVDNLSCKYINDTEEFPVVGWYLTINGDTTANEPLAWMLGIKPSKFKEMAENFTYQMVWFETFNVSVSVFEIKENAEAFILALKLMEER